LQSRIDLHDSRRQLTPHPSQQTIPIAADSKKLGNRLAASVRVVVPQLAEQGKRGSEIASLCELKRPEKIGLRSQVASGMEETKRARESPGKTVAMLRDELGCLSQSEGRREYQNKPGTAPDKSRTLRDQDPGKTRDDQDREGRQPPTAIQSAASPGLCEHDQRRDARDEKENVVEIEHCGI
jgi:hypothetical protein